MEQTERSQFIHSVPVPRLYKEAATIAKKVVEEGGSLKDLVYQCRHKNIKALYALIAHSIKYSQVLDRLCEGSKILKKEPRLDPWLARILITELFFGKKKLSGDCKPVKTILFYQKQLQNLFEKEKDALTESQDQSKVWKPRYVRVNTHRLTPDEAIKRFREEGWCFVPTPADYSSFLDTIANLDVNSFTRDFHIRELLVFPGRTQFHKHELYHNGSIMLQDKASCLSSLLLRPNPRSLVLDMCAAPGMKTSHLSAMMRNKGKIFATELSQKRFQILKKTLSSAGCTNVYPLNIDAFLLRDEDNPPSNVDTSRCKEIEYILVDPTCSGTGMVDREDMFMKEKNDPQRLARLSAYQFKLLAYALTKFPNAKRVVYSTCSVQPQENEEVVQAVMKKIFGDDNSEKGSEKAGASALGRPKFRLVEALKDTWLRRGREEYDVGRFCIYADAKIDLTNGFFIAVFERVNESVSDGETKGIDTKKQNEENVGVQGDDENIVSGAKTRKRKRKKNKKMSDVDNFLNDDSKLEEKGKKSIDDDNENTVNNDFKKVEPFMSELGENPEVSTQTKKKKSRQSKERSVLKDEVQNNPRSSKKRKFKSGGDTEDKIHDFGVGNDDQVNTSSRKKKKKRDGGV